MSFARTLSAQPHLLKGSLITIEADISENTLHAFSVVGLPDKAVEEAKDRVASALKNSGFRNPKSENQKIVISLSPADLKKEGSYFDVAIAIAYLLSIGDIAFNPEKKLFLGELSLSGEIKSIIGVLPLVQTAKNEGFEEVYVPEANAKEAALIPGIKIFAVRNLKDLIEHLDLQNKKNPLGGELPENISKLFPAPTTEIVYETTNRPIDLSDIRGQESAKRGLEIAASGGHNISMYGPPGTGKTMLARVFSDLLPDLSLDDILEITGIHSIAGALDGNLITRAPFRSPHHTASYVSIIGGGTYPKPGEVTLAHRGVLFLDEFPEFNKLVIESLRQPLEDNVVSISRAKGSANFPSQFILIAAMNPCPCGNMGTKGKICKCRPNDLERYKRKLSGPIMDRIDLWVQVAHIDYEKLGDSAPSGESTDVVRARIKKARDRQLNRFANHERKIKLNREMNVKDLGIYAPLNDDVKKILHDSAERLGLSARAYHRVWKLARTIADLDEKEDISTSHILEALQYRPKVYD